MLFSPKICGSVLLLGLSLNCLLPTTMDDGGEALLQNGGAVYEEGSAAQSTGLISVNLRDVVAAAEEVLQPGRLLRSSMIFSDSDLEQYGIKTVLDLRRESAEISWTFAGAKRAHIPFVNKAAGTAVLFSLPYSALFSLVTHCFKNVETVVVDHIMSTPESLAKFYLTILDAAVDSIKGVFRVLADEENYPILFHCVAGKDRTGLVAALVLAVCGIDQGRIIDDFALSEGNLREGLSKVPVHEHLLEERTIVSPPQAMRLTLQGIALKHGSVENYLLDHVGLTGEDLGNIRRIMMKESV